MLCNILLLFLLAAELSKLLANNFLMSLLQISDCVKKVKTKLFGLNSTLFRVGIVCFQTNILAVKNSIGIEMNPIA